MTKHTKGPWRWDGDICNYDPQEEAPWLVDENDNPVLSGAIVCKNTANSLLIAAAPEMLNALRRASIALAFASVRSEAMHDEYEIVKKAINKAIGVEND